MGPIRRWLSQTEMTAFRRGKICQSHFAFDTRKFLETENGEWKGGRMSPHVGGQETRGRGKHERREGKRDAVGGGGDRRLNSNQNAMKRSHQALGEY